MLVHGYADPTVYGFSCDRLFGGLVDSLIEAGWTNSFDYLRYYPDDRPCSQRGELGPGAWGGSSQPRMRSHSINTSGSDSVAAEGPTHLRVGRRSLASCPTTISLLLRLNKSWYHGIPADKLYDVTRAWWVMSAVNAERVVRVLAVAGGIVREVYEPSEWLQSPVAGLENRIGFNGSVASDRDNYVGRDVAHLFRPGSANPVRYLPLAALGAASSGTPTTTIPVAAEVESADDQGRAGTP